MKKCFTIISLLVVVMMYANNQNKFQLGVYSHLSNKQSSYAYSHQFRQFMKDMSYNVNVMELFTEDLTAADPVNSESSFQSFLNDLDQDPYSIDAVVIDRCWDDILRYSASC